MRFWVILVLLLCSLFSASCSPKEPAGESVPKLTQEEIEEKALEFVGLLSGQKFNETLKMFDERMLRALPEDKLQALWSNLLSQVGEFQNITGTNYAEEGEFKVVYVTCQFAKSALDVKVVYNDEGSISGLWFTEPRPVTAWEPPSYASPDAFSEIECTIGEGKWLLPGTLTMPKGKGPFPAVVLVHGSGPNDRDETVGPNKPFKDLAWGLAAKGIAVLRYEKRTRHYASELASMSDKFTVNEEVIEDALAAVEFLRKQDGVDPDKVFILGHSLGGMLCPRIAASGCEKHGENFVTGLILLAPNARNVADLILEQTEYLVSLDETEATQLDTIRKEVAKIKEGKIGEKEIVLGAPGAYWMDIMAYDPVGLAAQVQLPMLILQGERDYQVTMKDFSLWKEGLASHKRVKFRSYPDFNHLFMTGAGKSSPDEYQRPGHVDKTVIDDISNWIRKSF